MVEEAGSIIDIIVINVIIKGNMNTLLDRIWNRKMSFFGTFFVVFTLTYLFLVAIDFLPEPPSKDAETKETSIVENKEEVVSDNDTSVEEEVNTEEIQEVIYADLPVSISIAKLNKTIPVLNPESRSIADLDAALLDGVVRHPDSAYLNEEGNVFILGHSSYLPQVMNKNFQAFNGIQNLEWGDVIEVYSDGTIYEYRVEKVYRAKATEVTVPIAGSGNKLTLATCNSFGSTDDRYIVEAERVGTRSL